MTLKSTNKELDQQIENLEMEIADRYETIAELKEKLDRLMKGRN